MIKDSENLEKKDLDVAHQNFDASGAEAAGDDSIEVQEEHDEEEQEENEKLSVEQLVDKMEKLVNQANAGELYKKINALREHIDAKLKDIFQTKKEEYEAENEDASAFNYEHPLQSKFSFLVNHFKEKQDEFHKKQDKEHAENLVKRQDIIERLKGLYINPEPGIDLFKAIRKIKEEWANAGFVAKSEFKNLYNNYYYHLNGFYEMLDLNKEYREQEYAYNLAKRQHIIARAKELLEEPKIQKALNELQFLHKLWKEEGEPVAEEFRDSTWDEFKEVSDKIHGRKAELLVQVEAQQKENLEKKNAIIEQIKKLTSPDKSPNHNYWQQSIKKVEALREDFLKLGSVPKKLSNQNWTEFKQVLRAFNSTKNNFYKSLKNIQIKNLEEKQKLIKIAQDNQNSEDWETMVPFFKKLQNDWKAIGHVPRNQTNTIWDQFREACNHFFDNYREKGDAAGDDWNDNYKNKKSLLDELKAVEQGEDSVKIIEDIKNKWNTIGKVPKNKIGINNEFNRTLKEKLRLNNLNEFDLKEEGLSESQITDRARKLKNQIMDLEAEIVKLENNLSFFNNPTRDNPLLKDSFDKIDDKKVQLESLKSTLHQMISKS